MNFKLHLKSMPEWNYLQTQCSLPSRVNHTGLAPFEARAGPPASLAACCSQSANVGCPNTSVARLWDRMLPAPGATSYPPQNAKRENSALPMNYLPSWGERCLWRVPPACLGLCFDEPFVNIPWGLCSNRYKSSEAAFSQCCNIAAVI